MVFVKNAKKESDEPTPAPAYMASDIFKQEQRDARAKKREAEYEILSTEELKKLTGGKLEKEYKRECDKLITAWKDEKSLIIDIMRRKEIERVENIYQQHQLDLERERQEKRSKIFDKN